MYIDCIIETDKTSEIEQAFEILSKKKSLPFSIHTQWHEMLFPEAMHTHTVAD